MATSTTEQSQRQPKDVRDKPPVKAKRHRPTIYQIIAKIRRDSLEDPQGYVDEVEIPGGGE